MTHEDAGHYAAKHPENTKLNPKIEAAVKRKSDNGVITCAAAHTVADELNMPPAQVGVAIDLMEYRIAKCQMGMYGYDTGKPITVPEKDRSPELEEALLEAAPDKRITCKACWELAEKMGVGKLKLARTCEVLKIKIRPCQLGAF